MYVHVYTQLESFLMHYSYAYVRTCNMYIHLHVHVHVEFLNVHVHAHISLLFMLHFLRFKGELLCEGLERWWIKVVMQNV